jgi:hypothetical protein
MTPLEDMLHDAFRAKAAEVPPDMVPPLRLPARRRSLSPAYGGGGRKGAAARQGWRRLLTPAACTVVVAAVIAGSVVVSHLLHGTQGSGRHPQRAAAAQDEAATPAWNQAARWVAAQVSRSAVVSCDPMMCRTLEARGVPAGNLKVLRPPAADPLGSAVIVVTAAVRRELGGRLGSVYAPDVIASFGSGTERVDIRVVAPGGATAWRSALSADLAARKAAGAQLLDNKRIVFSVTARRQLLAGQADARLLITIASLAAQQRVSVVAFGGSGPGASPSLPLRSVDLAPVGRAGTMAAAAARSLLEALGAQHSPYRPAHVETLRLPGGEHVLRIEFAAPGLLGLLMPPGHGGA